MAMWRPAVKEQGYTVSGVTRADYEGVDFHQYFVAVGTRSEMFSLPTGVDGAADLRWSWARFPVGFRFVWRYRGVGLDGVYLRWGFKGGALLRRIIVYGVMM